MRSRAYVPDSDKHTSLLNQLGQQNFFKADASKTLFEETLDEMKRNGTKQKKLNF
jgi:hypothetical protein